MNRHPKRLVIGLSIAATTLLLFAGVRILTRNQERTVFFGDKRYSASEFFIDPRVAVLSTSAAIGALADADRAINQGADVNYVGLFDYTPLMWSIETGGLSGFEYLLTKGAQLNIHNRFTMSAMALASGPTPSSDFLAIALKHGGNPNFVELTSGDTPLFYAIRSGDTKRVDLLLKSGARIDAKNNKGVTPLLECAFTGQYKCALLLLQKGANPRAKDDAGMDFITAMENDDGIPPWAPSYWWKRRIATKLKGL